MGLFSQRIKETVRQQLSCLFIKPPLMIEGGRFPAVGDCCICCVAVPNNETDFITVARGVLAITINEIEGGHHPFFREDDLTSLSKGEMGKLAIERFE